MGAEKTWTRLWLLFQHHHMNVLHQYSAFLSETASAYLTSSYCKYCPVTSKFMEQSHISSLDTGTYSDIPEVRCCCWTREWISCLHKPTVWSYTESSLSSSHFRIRFFGVNFNIMFPLTPIGHFPYVCNQYLLRISWNSPHATSLAI
jgi:hypothetical protein